MNRSVKYSVLIAGEDLQDQLLKSIRLIRIARFRQCKSQRQPLLENFHDRLNETGFKNTRIHTDYQFVSPEAASPLAVFFLGEEIKQKLINE